jgi:choloylglycine hydrolase
MTDNQNQVHMGRNYDFKLDTSAMLVYCTPPNGYKSVAFAALDNISANTPDESMKKKLATLTSPFICLDGMNEKGVSIAVLTPAYYTAVSTALARTIALFAVNV